MRTRPTKERAESRVVNRYHKLYAPLIELIDSLRDLEPAGNLIDNVEISKRPDSGKIHVEYMAHPIKLTVKDGSRSFVLQVFEE